MKLLLCLCLSIVVAWIIGTFTRSIEGRKKIYLFLTGITFIFFLGFRGNQSADYINYVNLYDKIYNYFHFYNNPFSNLFSVSFISEIVDPGYAVLNLLIKYIFDDVLVVFVVSAVLTIIPLWRFLSKSPYLLFSIFLYLMIGTYLENFNIMRQGIASSLGLMSYSYIKERNFKKFFLVFLIAFSFQWSALVLLPAYFFLVPKKRKRSNGWRKFALIAVGLVAVLLVDRAAQMFINVFFGGKYNYSAGITEIPWTNAVIPTVCFVLTEFLFRFGNTERIDKLANGATGTAIDASDYVILENGMIIWFILQICCIRIPLVTRFASFFSPYILIFLPVSIYNLKKRFDRFVVISILVSILFLFMMLAIREDVLNQYVFIFN